MWPSFAEAVLGFCVLFYGTCSLFLFTGSLMWLDFHFGSQDVQGVATITCLFKSYHHPGKTVLHRPFSPSVCSCCDSYCLKTSLQV